MWALLIGAGLLAFWLYEKGQGQVPPHGVGTLVSNGITYYGILDQSAGVTPDQGETVWVHHVLPNGTDEYVKLAIAGPMQADGLFSLVDIEHYNNPTTTAITEGAMLPRTHFAIMPG
jgi:hypothetical protein